jgi:ATP-dependent helicase/nuclease subunit A
MNRNEATERQVQAAMPNASTWLAANAGSGKTRVLTDRVARLLLEGVQPQHILCLTYTKAAASEMQNRLFKRLGEWAMRGDDKLRATLTELGVPGDLTADRLAHARTLFARAIETPGGLKIQTIHSFCSSLLRRFPLEAGVSPQLSEMEDRATELLRAEIIEDFSDGSQAGLIEALARYTSDALLDKIAAAVNRNAEVFANAPDWDGLLALFDLPAGFDENTLRGLAFLGDEADVVANLIPALEAGGKTDQKNAATLRTITRFDIDTLPKLEKILLTGAGAKEPFTAKIGSFPTKAVQKDHPDLMARLEPLMLRIEDCRARRLGLAAARKTHVLNQFATAFIPEYERRKQLRGWLDFDDLILKARHLLNDPAVAAWVLYRLDGGIDHILVDEAQDTSPAQWDVIEKLAQEFTSGEGARSDVERTIFVVGDKKQSIYSFQGADPAAFDRMQQEFGARLADAGTRLENLTLEFSFRSSQAILGLVDMVFEEQAEAGFAKDSLHRAFKSDLPGRVDLWPVVEKVDDTDDRHWSDPVDRPSARHHNVILAEQIAQSIKQMIASGETIPEDGAKPGDFIRRPVQPGDFLILVQRRSDLFSEIIRACKQAELPIAGADRLKVGAELAVRDLAALLRFLATPEDDLSLATVLRSPLFGWSEQDLFTLSYGRKGKYLWQVLRDSAEHPKTLGILNDLRGQTDFLRPFDLIERILTRHDGRRNLLGRLGPEAEDGINALLSQALAYERSDIPSLTGFLVWMETDELEIKRQMGSAGNMIRVMTVHGSKGLEAPIVILPETGARRAPPADEIMVSDGQAFWKTPADQTPPVLATARDAALAKQMNERLRLLYVALTRAEKWLIVAAAGELSKDGNTWYQMTQSAMQDAGAVTCDFANGAGLRLQHGDWTAPPLVTHKVETRETTPLPDLFRPPFTPRPDPLTTLSPSDLGGAKALPGDAGLDEEAAMLRGTRIHLLLEHLAGVTPANHENIAQRLLPDCPDTERKDLVQEAVKPLSSPALSHIFAPDTLAEVPITAPLRARRIHGIIDRLIISDMRILAVDFKTNATVPTTAQHVPEGVLRQMGAYSAALAQIYPGYSIETAIVWTRTASLMPLPHDLVSDAVKRAPSLDDTGGPT